MSDPKWLEHMKTSFPDWIVFDSSGNNFYMVCDLNMADGKQVMVGIAENVSYVLRHKDSDRFVTFVTDYILSVSV